MSQLHNQAHLSPPAAAGTIASWRPCARRYVPLALQADRHSLSFLREAYAFTISRDL
jgi:hypothetical protein